MSLQPERHRVGVEPREELHCETQQKVQICEEFGLVSPALSQITSHRWQAASDNFVMEEGRKEGRKEGRGSVMDWPVPWSNGSL
jgi:hypothetical protein